MTTTSVAPALPRLPRRHTVRAYAFTPGVPPRDAQLWMPGDNPTDYGNHRWTERSITEVMAAYEATGNPLQVDIEHNCSPLKADFRLTDEPPVTGGYARLEIRNGAPWLTFDWSAFAVEQIETRQRLFLSPEYIVDEATGEIVELLRVSLVSSPGTHNARVLASSRKCLSAAKGMDLETLIAAVRAAVGNEDAEAAKAAVLALLAELDKGSAPAGDAPPADEPVAAEGDAPADDKKEEPVAADEDPPKEEPVAAEEKKDEPVAAAAKPVARKPTIKAASPSESAALRAVAELRRDMLLRDHGDRLEPSIRRWAASQPASVVEGLIKAAAKKVEPQQRVAATRGGFTAASAPEVVSELDARMGLATSAAPIRREGTKLTFAAMTPVQARQLIAAKAAKKGGAQ